MGQRITAISIFFGAIGDLLRASGVVARIAGVPFAVFVILQIPVAIQYANWRANAADLPPPTGWYEIVFFLVMLPFVASAWHRFKINGEVPRGVVALGRPAVALKYLGAWLAIAVLLVLAVAIGVVLPLALLGQLFEATAGNVFGAALEQGLGTGSFDATVLLVSVASVGLVIWVYIWLLFRLGLGLPSIAVNEGKGIGLRASWRATRGLARTLAGAAALAAIAKGIMFAVSMLAGRLLGGTASEVAYFGEFTALVIYAAFDMITVLLAAAVLTRIYRAAQVDEAQTGA